MPSEVIVFRLFHSPQITGFGSGPGGQSYVKSARQEVILQRIIMIASGLNVHGCWQTLRQHCGWGLRNFMSYSPNRAT